MKGRDSAGGLALHSENCEELLAELSSTVVRMLVRESACLSFLSVHECDYYFCALMCHVQRALPLFPCGPHGLKIVSGTRLLQEATAKCS